jgi:hypothetical protein
VFAEKPLKTKLDFKELKVAVLCVKLLMFFKVYFSAIFFDSIVLFTMVEENVLLDTSKNIARQALNNMVFIVDMILSKVDKLINL